MNTTWNGHADRLQKIRNEHKILVENHEEHISLQRPRHKERIILKLSLTKLDLRMRTQFISLRSVSNEKRALGNIGVHKSRLIY